ncbi:MAG: adenylate/guanylate cyclase domain-containing protein [Alphaproteobacteria bacterium]|nr:adenylate/guanylate cyclase domain-containing protein [Alphaproteobacteria bacterium]
MGRVGGQRNLRIILGYTVAGALFGIAYVVASLPLRGESILRGILTGGLIAGGIAASEVAARSSRIGAPLRRLPFLAFVVVKSLIWMAWIVAALVLVRAVFPIPAVRTFESLGADIAYSMLASMFCVVVFELNRLLGPGMLLRIITGRYHTPRIEERAFLLLDLAGSTAIAERIGPARFLALLDFLIGELTPVLVAHRAEIYRYVGDAIIVTWTLEDAIADARCVRCSAAVGARLAALQPECRRRYDVAVEGRAALHAGPVAVGEIGELKREITMLGDTLNTAAKMEKIAGELGRRAVISGELLARLRLPATIRSEPLGDVTVPGRSQPLALHALQLWPG